MRSTITLSAPEVARILAGATQIRVPVKLPKWAELGTIEEEHPNGLMAICEATGCLADIPCPYLVGYVLAVREPWCIEYKDGMPIARPRNGEYEVLYAADERDHEVIATDDDGFQKWNADGTAASPWLSGAAMPTWAARMHLRVLTVRAQRVADITEGEAKACGFGFTEPFSGKGKFLEAWRLRHGSAEWAWVIGVERVEVPLGK